MFPKLIPALALLFGSASAHSIEVALPDQITSIKLSNKDINRINCQRGSIKDTFFSEEKGITVDVKGNNAFIKFKILKNGAKTTYATNPSEFYIACGGDVYTLIAQPKTIPAQTITLGGGVSETMKKTITLMEGMDREERIIFLTKAAFNDDQSALEVFKTEKAQHNVVVYEGMQIEQIRKIRALGAGLELFEYVITAEHDLAVHESDFLRSEFGENIAAISVLPHRLTTGQKARLFVIQSTGG